MNVVDIIILLFLISSMVRGYEIGSIRQIFSMVGFFGGLYFGAWIEPHFVHFAHTTLSRSWLTLGITCGCALILLVVGEYIGAKLKTKLMHHHEADKLDRGLGTLVGAVMLLGMVWIICGILVSLPFPSLQSQLKGSAIVRVLDQKLPPAPIVLADLSHAIDPNGFPKVFIGVEPAPLNPNVKLPSLGILAAAVTKDEASVVKIEGEGCGGIVEGSGFIVAPDTVATNAHVVAGVSSPYIVDQSGEHPATVIWFDPNLDLAVLTTRNLKGSPLIVADTTVNNDTQAAVLGYPGGGNFTASPAVVLEEFIATGRNIYNQGNTDRNVYEIKANVIPGNSGGPLITINGKVIGVVFAESTTYNQVGYALATPQVLPEIHQAEARNQTVTTGTCAE
jgi:S1-C subfamily serine protease